ncbi:hypothetical protein [Variovorax sp. UMC13]|uniref:hypothetical protein n=1 Tax=Variovorax sp. UMC13 TaxID=1862326 RepID=UPI001601A9A6|nr:hypothetical protein [Variovorax sp. UMC13]MBB1599466.1 hypothetical protein [Variovorax sp. UMC13]
MIENEYSEHVGRVDLDLDPVANFTALAVQCGLIRSGDKLDQNVLDLCAGVVSLCAGVADEYENPSCPEDTVGDHLRAVLFEH